MNWPLRYCPLGVRAYTRRVSQKASLAYLRFYSAAQSQIEPRLRASNEEERYPRVTVQKGVLDYLTFKDRYKTLPRGESRPGVEVVVRGRIWTFRIAGSKLGFIDLVQNNGSQPLNSHQVQCKINYQQLGPSGVQPSQLKDFLYTLHRGDVLSVKGIPHRTERNELSVLATELPQILSPCLQSLPEQLTDKETKMRNRHVDFLLNPRLADTVRLRSEITNFLRRWLSREGHIEVQTPILAETAGGAIARPFHTSATEFQGRQITLRIAPELWLKRLILGGFERVFEIGPSFRNEGVDLSHNPEFTTCEFYQTYASLDELIKITEDMFMGLSRVVQGSANTELRSLNPAKIDFSPPLPRLDFIPAIEAAIGVQLPKLNLPSAQADLLMVFAEHKIPLPSLPTVPRLLDKLCTKYLEPQCFEPKWIINPPECLSPLSKSFLHPHNHQRVSARAELFVRNQELVNTYEEENSPIEQRRKFEEQLRRHEGDADTGVDENYIQALEWGLPPTGGWGCGIDRLCMLFAGTARIADVLPFGTLRNVIGLGRDGKKP